MTVSPIWQTSSLRIFASLPPLARLGPLSSHAIADHRGKSDSTVNGKLSALRWVMGSEWDFLDTWSRPPKSQDFEW
jgi:hypothetical protein